MTIKQNSTMVNSPAFNEWAQFPFQLQLHLKKYIDYLQPELKKGNGLHQNGHKSFPGEEDHDSIEIASLVLAYTSPITLKFRPDEKRLDVDGAYNIRYEMLKKRIEKATILGKAERLTQPGHLSVVFTQDQDLVIYERHFHYLVKKEKIEPGWELLELEPMQGVESLRAMRAKVKDQVKD